MGFLLPWIIPPARFLKITEKIEGICFSEYAAESLCHVSVVRIVSFSHFPSLSCCKISKEGEISGTFV